MSLTHPGGAPPQPYAQYLPPHPPQPTTPPPPRRTTRWTLALAGLAVILAAAALIVALLRQGPTPAPPAARPTTPATPAYTTEQVTAAKDKTCKAAKTINDRLLVESNWPKALGPDDALGWARYSIGRTDYLAAAVWLPTQVDPATPSDLRAAVTAFAAAAGAAVGSAGTSTDDLDHAHAVMSSSYEQIERGCG